MAKSQSYSKSHDALNLFKLLKRVTLNQQHC